MPGARDWDHTIMPAPQTSHEGNLRFAGLPTRGFPEDPLVLAAQVRSLLEDQAADHYGSPTVVISGPPAGHDLGAWDCLCGVAVTGLPKAVGGLIVEDYRDLHSLALPHRGPTRDLAATWEHLAEAARHQGRRLRPYWRIRLLHRRLADGNLLPQAEVAVFAE